MPKRLLDTEGVVLPSDTDERSGCQNVQPLDTDERSGCQNVQPLDTDERSGCQNLMKWCGGRH